ncbi:MAG: segregation/condensation protein A [Alicyclobacillaceae bacterium]|nr:segregation/condensation protein A [Alicyclobacillaceae bacterium]
MAYEVALDAFSGPLDLLLNLIQKHEIDIHDIPVSVVTDQYIAYLRSMEELSLEVASEFLVMAATLLAIKSRMLLPRPPRPTTADEDELAEDPRDALVQQLIAYQRIKQAADMLRDRAERQRLVYSRPPMQLSASAPDPHVCLTGVSLWDLVDAFRKLMNRLQPQDRVAEVRVDAVTVEEMMNQLLVRLQRTRAAWFSDLVGMGRTRAEWVTAFLALLELVKEKRVVCRQTAPFEDIEICLRGEAEAC